MQLRLSMVTLLSCISLSIFCAADDDYKLMHIGNVTHQNTFRIDVSPGMTVRQLKELIEEHEEVPVNQQHLYKHEVVEDGCFPKRVKIELHDDQLCSSYDFRRYEVVALHGDKTRILYIADMLREQTFGIKVLDDMTIYGLKQKIQKHSKIPVDIQVLQIGERVSGGFFPKYKSITLEDDQLVSFYKFGRYQVVQLRRVNASVKDAQSDCSK